MIPLFRGLCAAVALALAAGCSNAQTAKPLASAEQATIPVEIRTGSAVHVFHVEVARSEAQQQRGLMHRTSLPADGGMLFPFTYPRRATFWMKNTLIPLDIIFIRTDGTIARIANATPLSLDLVDAGEAVGAVLEIRGGGAAAAGIKAGDRVSWAGGPQPRQ